MTDMHHHTELSFVDEFQWVSPLHYKKTDSRMLFFFGACCKRGSHLYTTTSPSCCIPASCCHLSATLRTISITVANLHDNRAVFRIVIALLKFSFDSPSDNERWRRTIHQTQSNASSAVSSACSIWLKLFIPESPRKFQRRFISLLTVLV